MEPVVSVIIPVYNQERYIRECIESAISQDFPNLEVIVVDDGSTDSTPRILGEYAGRIRCITQRNRGVAAALNTGIRQAKGSLIAWLSSDDVYLPGKISCQVRRFQDSRTLGLVYTDWIMIDGDGKELKVVKSPYPTRESFAREMLAGNFINGSTILMRKECFEAVGYFDETITTDSDGDMWFRLLKHGGYALGHIDIPLLKYRWHSGNTSHKYLLHQRCKDEVRLMAVERFSSNDLFRDLIATGKPVGPAYEELARALARQKAFRAADKVMKKAIAQNISLGRVATLVWLQVAFLRSNLIYWWHR